MRTKKSTKILTGFFYITALCSIAFTIYISNNSKKISSQEEESRVGVTIIENQPPEQGVISKEVKKTVDVGVVKVKYVQKQENKNNIQTQTIVK